MRYYKHLGFYAYRKAALDAFCSWPESALERSERLEQLRFLDHGIAIHVAETPFDTVGWTPKKICSASKLSCRKRAK